MLNQAHARGLVNDQQKSISLMRKIYFFKNKLNLDAMNNNSFTVLLIAYEQEYFNVHAPWEVTSPKS